VHQPLDLILLSPDAKEPVNTTAPELKVTVAELLGVEVEAVVAADNLYIVIVFEAGPSGPAIEKVPPRDKAPVEAVYLKKLSVPLWVPPKEKFPSVSRKNPLLVESLVVLLGV
jgi:hypothetical protein